MKPPVTILGLAGIPEVSPGDDLAEHVLQSCRRQDIQLESGDVIVVTQKIVSKSEGCVIPLDTVIPSKLAMRFATDTRRDPRLVELALRESRRVVKMDRVLITETHHGFICANSGVDCSNIAQADSASTLPRDPDGSAARLREALEAAAGCHLAIVISDTFGRPWREGVVEFAIGSSGIEPLLDYRGHHDAQGRELTSTVVAVADELAAAADLVMGKTDGIPVALIRGFAFTPSELGAKALLRDPERDLFR